MASSLRRLARSILRRSSPEGIVAQDPFWRVVDAWPYGDVHVLEQLWHGLGILEVIAEVLGTRKFDFALERSLFAMVANRTCAPAPNRACRSCPATLRRRRARARRSGDRRQAGQHVQRSAVSWAGAMANLVSDLRCYYGDATTRSPLMTHRRPPPASDGAGPGPTPTRAQMTWAQRLRRVFDIDISHCPRCGAALRVLAVIS